MFFLFQIIITSRKKRMPSLKKVTSLRDIANKFISKCVANYCVDIDERASDDETAVTDDKCVKALSSVLEELPGVLLDDLIRGVIAFLLLPGARQEAGLHAPAPGLHVALRLLPQARVNIGQKDGSNRNSPPRYFIFNSNSS